jgi:hypothetical protein
MKMKMKMKKNPCVRSFALALLLALAALPLAASPAQESTPQPMPISTSRFEIRFMDLHAAEQLAWDQCSNKERCQISASAFVSNDPSARWVGETLKGFLDVRADTATHERISRALAKADAAPLTQSFQVLLLAASARPANGPEVPEAARKALADLRSFLPYKGYQVLDSSWLRATQDKVTEGRVVGRDGAGYSLKLRFRITASEELFVDAFELNEEPWAPSPAPEGSKEGKARAPHAPRDLISTSFSLKKGETIVVGTSKLDGSDEALVVLLTAVPQG